MTLVGRTCTRVEEWPDSRRMEHVPLWAHLVALAVALLAMVPVIGTDASFTGDEGAAIIQAQMLADGEGWLAPNRFAAVDPEAEAFGLAQSDTGSKGFAPFAKHPAYPVLLAVADRVGGVAAMVVLSIAGTVGASALAGLLAARIDPVLQRPSIWVTGLASPMLFHGYSIIGHSLGAALCAGAALSLLRFLERRGGGAAFGTLACVAGACALRNEALVFAGALTVVTGVTALARRNRPALLLAGSVAITAAAVQLLDAFVLERIVGSRGGVFAPPRVGDFSFLEARWLGLWATSLRPSRMPGIGTGDVLLTLVLAMGLAAAVIVRRRPTDVNGLVVMTGVGAIAAVARLVVAPIDLIPGLLLAFPLLSVAICLWDRGALAAQATRLPTAIAGLFALGVLLLQYPVGGFLEWGGRYFALALPLVVPIALHVLYRRRAQLDTNARRVAVAGLAVVTAATSFMAVASLRGYHERFGALVDDVQASTRGHEPVIVTSQPLVARLAWKSYREQRWLTALDSLEPYVPRLRASGVERLTLVTSADQRGEDLARLAPLYVPIREYPRHDRFIVLVLRAR
jgi:hypothetical protein